MNYLQKQAALQKLAQVRLAINYVMRNRGMKKQAEPGVPGYGYFTDPDPKYPFNNQPAPYLPYLPREPNTPIGEQDRFNTVRPDGLVDYTRWNWTWDGSENKMLKDPYLLYKLHKLNRTTPENKVRKFGPSGNNIVDFNNALDDLYIRQENPKYKNLTDGTFIPSSERETWQERVKRINEQGPTFPF